ncbi:MAG: tRNA (N6-isopentenyl adenosine(37)-C2)-methylthiotransferase MiaB [bacterium]
MHEKNTKSKQKTYNILIIGCQMNKSDSERIASYLENLGYVWVNNPEQADLFVLTTCGVRQGAEDRIYGIVPQVRKANNNVKIILTGCLSDREDVRKRLAGRVDIWLNVNDLPGLAERLGEEYHPGSLDYLNINPKYNSKYSAYVPIGNGCNNFCSYCVVPYARGREVYRPHQEVLAEVKSLAKKGYKEIILIAQNVNSYKSGEIDFAQLLKMTDQVPGDFWLRFSTSHPKDLSDDLIKVIKNGEKICHHLHMAVQAGDNEILKAMNRKYTVEHYLSLIEKIKQAIPDIALTTDIIVGFPGETREQFANTKKLMETVGYDMAYTAQYSPRYGTVSAKMEDNVPNEEKKIRERELMNIIRKTSLENNKKYLNKEVRVLVEGRKKDGQWYGKESHFKTVKFTSKVEQDLVGEFVNVLINRVEDLGLYGEQK